MEDWHNFSADYDKTLMVWHNNFEENWDGIRLNYSDRFYRMWRYYLLSCAGAFRARQIQLWQIVYSPSGVPGGYNSIR
jgi:cyclopropane-fatty-acyl-phospholipid synthase